MGFNGLSLQLESSNKYGHGVPKESIPGFVTLFSIVLSVLTNNSTLHADNINCMVSFKGFIAGTGKTGHFHMPIKHWVLTNHLLPKDYVIR